MILKDTAFVFPGQSTHYVGMGKEIHDNFKVAKDFYEMACDLTGVDIRKLCFEGPEEVQRLTENNQPIIHTTSLAIAEVMDKEYGFGADTTGGYSLGQYSALVYAGSLEFKDTVDLVKKRGFYMQEAVPVGLGKMVASLGLDDDDLDAVVEEASKVGHIQVSNVTCPGQRIVAGYNAPVEKAAELIEERGGKAVFLAVSGPFHTSLLTTAADNLNAEFDIRGITAKDPQIRYVDNVTGTYETTGIRELLHKHVSHAVLWEPSMDAMLLEGGIRNFIELGSINFLTNANKRCADKHNIAANCYNIRDMETLNEFLRFADDNKEMLGI